MDKIERSIDIEAIERAADIDNEILFVAEQMLLLHKQAFITQLANIVASVALFIGMYGVVSDSILSGWLVSVLLFNFVRYTLDRRYFTNHPSIEKITRWEQYFLTMVMISGLFWGFAAIAFFISGDVAHELFLALVLVGVGAGAVGLLSYHSFAYPLFAVPVVVPITLQLLFNGEQMIELIAGAVMPVYFVVMLMLSRQIYSMTRNSIYRQVEQIQLAHVDHLTRISNRRAFDSYLSHEWRRGTRTSQPLSIIIADIDDFKKYNDTYGHAAGDEILKAIADMLHKSLKRSADMVARIGGEEFAIILPNTSCENAVALAENIRKKIRKKMIMGFGHHYDDISMSFGVSSCQPKTDITLETLVQQADMALYCAKRGGKDRVDRVVAKECEEDGCTTAASV